MICGPDVMYLKRIIIGVHQQSQKSESLAKRLILIPLHSAPTQRFVCQNVMISLHKKNQTIFQLSNDLTRTKEAKQYMHGEAWYQRREESMSDLLKVGQAMSVDVGGKKSQSEEEKTLITCVFSICYTLYTIATALRLKSKRCVMSNY